MALTYPDEFTIRVRRSGERWGIECLDGGANGKTLPEALRNCAEMLEVTEGIGQRQKLNELPSDGQAN